MKLFLSTHTLLLAFALKISAAPEPQPAKVIKYRSDEIDRDYENDADSRQKDVASNGRLFMRKFFFNKIFGHKQNQYQPIIPIIITGSTTDTDGIVTIDETPITTDTDITDPESPESSESPDAPETTESPDPLDDGANPVNPAGRIQLYGRPSNNKDNKPAGDAEHFPEDVEYFIIDQGIKGASLAKANRAPAYVNLRLRDTERGQIVNVRLPAKYNGYFKSGQRVLFQKSDTNRPSKRRVYRKRTNCRKANRNKNKGHRSQTL